MAVPDQIMSKESESDSSYSVDENEDPVIKPQPVAPASPSSPAKQEACQVGTCCCRCPFARLSSENLEATLEQHELAVERIQSVLMFRRPIAAAAVFVGINLVFFIYRALNLPFLSNLCLLLLCSLIIRQFAPIVVPLAEGFLFGDDVPKGEANESNRIRSTKEVSQFLVKIVAPIEYAVKTVRKIASDTSVVGRGIYFGVLLCLLILTKVISVFWVIVIVVDCALVLPGVLLHPQVAPMIADLKGKVKQD